MKILSDTVIGECVGCSKRFDVWDNTIGGRKRIISFNPDGTVIGVSDVRLCQCPECATKSIIVYTPYSLLNETPAVSTSIISYLGFMPMENHSSIGVANAQFCLQPIEEQQRIFTNRLCDYSGEKLNYRTNRVFDNIGEYAHYFVAGENKILIKGKFINRIGQCSYCGCFDLKKDFNVWYDDRNNKRVVCPEHEKTLPKDFFGFNFRFLKGRGEKHNPFERLVGIELETIGGDSFSTLELPKSIQTKVRSAYDGSLYTSNNYGEEDDDDFDNDNYHQDDDRRNRGAGREFITVPIGRDSLFKTVDDLCRFLRQKNCLVNKSCGLHLHFDMREETIETSRKTFLIFSLFEQTLFDMLPPSRRNSRYCLPLKKDYKEFFSSGFDEYWYGSSNHNNLRSYKREKYNNTRYSSINYHSLFYHSTLENRQHSGTINSRKIKNWILINQILIDYAKSAPIRDIIKLSGSHNNLFKIIRLYEKKYPVLKKHDLTSYFKERFEKFHYSDNKPLKIKDEMVETPLFAKAKAECSFRETFDMWSGEYKGI